MRAVGSGFGVEECGGEGWVGIVGGGLIDGHREFRTRDSRLVSRDVTSVCGFDGEDVVMIEAAARL